MDKDRQTFVEKIKVLDIRPGDILVLLCPRPISSNAVDFLKQCCADVGINENRVLILDEGIDLKVIRSESLKAELEPIRSGKHEWLDKKIRAGHD